MRHENTLDIRQAALAIIDMQESFRRHIPDFSELAAHVALVAHAAQLLGVAVVVTEQYPKGLGHTAAEIRAVLPEDFEPVEKTAFSSCGAGAFVSRLEEAGAGPILLCGIEAQLCVNQTAHDLPALGLQDYIIP